jgi:hypothetical protein
MRLRNLLFTLAVASMPVPAQAATCEQLKAGIIEGATMYKTPSPTFRLSHVIGAAGPDREMWDVEMFDAARAMMMCRHGSVETFAADANNGEMKSSLHLMLLMAMGLHGYGLDWRPALLLRDKLISTTKASGSLTAELPVGGGKASFVISIAGVPSFQIDSE